jgi:plastocyanin
MSQCYDFQKWTMISLATIAISLTVGLVSLVYGQENEVTITIVQGSADAGSGENKYEGEAHSGFGFDPPELTIEKGTIVKWMNNDTSIHTVTSGKPGTIILFIGIGLWLKT